VIDHFYLMVPYLLSIAAYLLKARTAEPEKQQLLGNVRTQQ
jgi:hypothetical protein